jgi:UDP-glucuronate 4-epimerase
MHTALHLAEEGHDVVGIDNLNTYYSVDLKLLRLKEQGISTQSIVYNKLLQGNDGIRFAQLDVTDEHNLSILFLNEQFDYVIHLAAQAGVRYSIENPHAYIDSNVKGFLHILENCQIHRVKHLIFGSSSSVYGKNSNVPFEETDTTEHPVSLYAATKKSNELMAHSYAAVHQLPVTGLRFFTVYGPFGRPDMAIFKFTENI